MEAERSNVAGILPVVSLDDPVQFAVIQPVEFTILAILDNDVASAAIKMGVHWLGALRAPDAPIHFAPVRLTGRLARTCAAPAQNVDDFEEGIHPDQHPAALGAIKNPMPGHCRMNEGNCADRAKQRTEFGENPNAFLVFLGQVNGAAVVADQAFLARLQAHGRATIRTIQWASIGWTPSNLQVSGPGSLSEVMPLAIRGHVRIALGSGRRIIRVASGLGRRWSRARIRYNSAIRWESKLIRCVWSIGVVAVICIRVVSVVTGIPVIVGISVVGISISVGPAETESEAPTTPISSS